MTRRDAPEASVAELGILFDRHPQPMWILDCETQRFRAVNDAAVEQYGYSRSEFLTMTAGDIRPSEDVPRLQRHLQQRQAATGVLVPSGTWRHRRKDGSVMHVDVTASDVQFEARPAWLVIAYDVTERVKAERRLALSERSLQDAQAVAQVGSWEWNVATGDVVCSQQLYRIYGVDPEAFTPAYDVFLALVQAEERETVRDTIESCTRDGTSLSFETRIVRPDGAVRDIHVRGEYLRDPDSGEVRLVGAAQDVTERKRAEEERARLLASEQAARAEAEGALARLRQIHVVTDTALALLGLDELLDETLSRLRAAIGADAANVLLLSESGPWLVVRASQGVEGVHVIGDAVPVGRGIAGRVATLRHAIAVADVEAHDGLRTTLRGRVRSMMAAPLLVEGQVVGVLDVGTRARHDFGDHDLRYLQMVADRMAPVIDRARLVEKLEAGRKQLAIVSERLVATQEAERAEIARELHDEVGQLLTGLKLMLETPGAPARQEEMKAIVHDLMARVRGLSMSLRPPMLDDLGLVPALLWLVQHYSTQTGIEVVFCHHGLDGRLRAELETAAFRIVQEALTNVARHAAVKRAAVAVHAQGDSVRLEVRDEGRGFDVGSALGSAGLAGMRERARLVGGRLSVLSEVGGGTRV
ncbi:MAG TPA: PAS domain S-box protein, partial [Vicinamibacteria bacterium]